MLPYRTCYMFLATVLDTYVSRYRACHMSLATVLAICLSLQMILLPIVVLSVAAAALLYCQLSPHRLLDQMLLYCLVLLLYCLLQCAPAISAQQYRLSCPHCACCRLSLMMHHALGYCTRSTLLKAVHSWRHSAATATIALAENSGRIILETGLQLAAAVACWYWQQQQQQSR